MTLSTLAATLLVVGAFSQAGAAPSIQLAPHDPSLIIDEDIRDRVAQTLSEQGVDADYDGTAVRLVRGPRRTEMSWDGQTQYGHAICVSVEPVSANGDMFTARPFLLIGSNVVLVRDPNPANEVWGAMWSPLAIDSAAPSVRRAAQQECARPAD